MLTKYTFAQWADHIVRQSSKLPPKAREAFLIEEITDALKDAYRAGALAAKEVSDVPPATRP
jgi:hypothetical protein